MATKQLVETFLTKKICFHLVRVVKIQKVPGFKSRYYINVSYDKPFLTTRYDMQCDGSFLNQNIMDIVLKNCNIPYNNSNELTQDIKFLNAWSITVVDDQDHTTNI